MLLYIVFNKTGNLKHVCLILIVCSSCIGFYTQNLKIMRGNGDY